LVAKSLDAKCEPRTFVDLLAAEDAFRFPDGNEASAFSVLVA
jgi:hypothetical protein